MAPYAPAWRVKGRESSTLFHTRNDSRVSATHACMLPPSDALRPGGGLFVFPFLIAEDISEREARVQLGQVRALGEDTQRDPGSSPRARARPRTSRSARRRAVRATTAGRPPRSTRRPRRSAPSRRPRRRLPAKVGKRRVGKKKRNTPQLSRALSLSQLSLSLSRLSLSLSLLCSRDHHRGATAPSRSWPKSATSCRM